jgi:hypothetical protein
LSNLAQMSPEDAADKAVTVLLAGSYIKSTVMYDDVKREEDVDWKDYISNEFDGALQDSSTWDEFMYEISGPYTLEGYTAKVEATYGGEGKGDEYWVVISITDGTVTRYFRKDGWYASYTGGELDGDTREVTPQERTVVFYE